MTRERGFEYQVLSYNYQMEESKEHDQRGQWCKDHGLMKEEIKLHFEERLKERSNFNIKLGNVDFSTITYENNMKLLKKISDEEIRMVLWKCEMSKSMRPNRFNFTFIKTF